MPAYQKAFRRNRVYQTSTRSAPMKRTGRIAKVERLFVSAGIPRPNPSSMGASSSSIFYAAGAVNLVSAAGGVFRYTAQYAPRDVMNSIIGANPRVVTMLNAFEFVALVWYRLRYYPKDHVFNQMDGATFQTIAVDNAGQAAVLGNPAAAGALLIVPEHTTTVGIKGLSKTHYVKADCDRLNVPFWQASQTNAVNFYIPGAGGNFPSIMLGVNTETLNPPALGNVNAGYWELSAKIAFKAAYVP